VRERGYDGDDDRNGDRQGGHPPALASVSLLAAR
jgi:hypothetical protein